MEIVSIGLLLAIVYPATLALENKYIPPALPEYSLQSLDEYTGLGDTILPAHTFDEDGYRYRVGRILRLKRATLDAATPATFRDLYADSKAITQNLPDSNFLGPSPDEIAVPSYGDGPSPDAIALPSYGTAAEDSYQGPSPDQIARPATGFNTNRNQYATRGFDAPRLSALQPFQQAFIQSAVFGDDGYRYKTVRRTSIL